MITNILRNYSTKIKIQKINKLLIANRGEIACRVIKTAKKLGVKTVAVYSDADKNSMHTSLADEAYYVGPPSSQESYLCGDKIMRIAKSTKSHAIHPGYGFLSENVEFAELCEKENIIFLGPPASAIRDMGIKSTSKYIMEAAGVPVIKGYHGNDQSNDKLVQEADKIGYPLMIKAVRGGGGKGMRIVESKADFLNSLESARIESLKAFGDNTVLLEKYVTAPRHVEVQIFGDLHGNYVYLYERDCSVQRRHQKIIEEAPAPGLAEPLRMELGKAAVRAAAAVGYVGAGTVEFILDKNDLSFHFMEMNTRLQVEHPITEMITGTDLVEWQIKVASGETLPMLQNQIKRNGHAFEARVYAESPRNNFLPGAGPLTHLTYPLSDANVRVETGVREGDDVSIHYDPMIAKLVVWGKNRNEALNKLISCLGDYQITGLDTNINFLIDLATHQEFQLGNVHTNFIAEHYTTLFPPINISENVLCEAVGIMLMNELNASKLNGLNVHNYDPFKYNAFRMNYDIIREFKFTTEDKEFNVQAKVSDGKIIVNINVNTMEWIPIDLKILHEKNKKFTVQSEINGKISKFNAVIDNDEIHIFKNTGKITLNVIPHKFLNSNQQFGGSNLSYIRSPMPGVLEKLFVKSSDQVKKGDNLAIIIAMKMEHVLKAPRDGKIKTIATNLLNKNVAKNEVIIRFEEDDE